MSNLDSVAVIDRLTCDTSLRVFVRGGLVETIPAKMSRRRLMLDAIAQEFEPGIRYPEPDVDRFLRLIHPDHAALRRYLVDEGFLARADGRYWRIGSIAPA